MRITITLPELPAGYAVANIPGGGYGWIQTAGHMTSAEGQEFIRRIERGTHPLLHEIQKATGELINTAGIVSLLAVIQRDRTTHVYINEPRLDIEVRPHGSFKAGDHVGLDDIADVRAVVFHGVSIPPDAGIIAVFSHGWRRAFYYNYTALGHGADPNTEDDIARDMARCMRRLMYEERFSITEAEWSRLFAAKLFPFIGLRDGVIDRMLSHARAGVSLDEAITEVVADLKERLNLLADGWKGHPAFADHLVILDRAVERHAAGDFVSATGLIYPRIEGVLRSGMNIAGATVNPTQSTMSASATAGVQERILSLVHPDHFQRYLREIYFANFSPSAASIPVGRNSVSHGVASADAFGEAASALGLLILYQLAISIPRTTASAP